MLFNNRKGSAAVVVLVIIIILIVVGWLISISGRECKKNEDCKADHYCGSDFKCHEFPVIIKEKNNLFWPSVIIIIAIIIGAIILKYKKD